MKFPIGSKVIERKRLTAHTSYTVSVVQAYLDGAVLTSMWGDGFGDELHHFDFMDHDKPGSRAWHSAIERFQESELCTFEEALEELKRLEAAKSKLNQEFEEIRFSIRDKMEQAASLVKDAAAIAKPFHKTFYDLKSECSLLYKELDAGGWSHSSMKC